MGEVYRARDTRLDRQVAIKILPADLSQSAQFRLRFEREAKTISQLNHPHICTLYDVGENYLVMELLDGESLADRLARGPLAIEEVLRYGIQIAGALDRAHRQGVVHRDLKPGNIMLTKSGAKLLDFGLAKESAGASPLAAETVQKPLTTEGTIVGTFQYMAPEQLEGEPADARTDIFALGAVLYEMATGKRAFEGKTRTSLIAAIVSGRPAPISQLQPLSPPALEHVIERCLEKDPADRWQSARDVAEELKWIDRKGSQAGVAAPVAARKRTFAWILPVITAAIAAAITWGSIEIREEPPRRIESTLLPPPKTQFAYELAGTGALSPDGTRIVFPALGANGHVLLYFRNLSGGSAQPLAGTEDAFYPFWSPDGRMIAFFVPGKLKKIDAAGGPPQAVADAPQGRGGSWSPQGVIVFTPALSGPMMKVSDSGGIATLATRLAPAKAETTHRWPCFLPDGRHFIYVANAPGLAGHRIMLASIDGDSQRELVRANSNAIYSPTGHLLYLRERSLVAQPFDAKTFTLGRDAIPIAENVFSSSGRMDGAFTVSGNGVLAYAGGIAPLSQLIWVDFAGKAIGSVGNPMNIVGLAISHDGRRVVVAIADPGNRSDLWVQDLTRSTTTRLTFDPGDESNPSWSPDDSMILYSSNAKSPDDVMIKRSSGTGTEETVWANQALKIASDWSPDGKTIAVTQLDPAGKTNLDLWFYSLEDHKARVFVQTPFAEVRARFSPDGRWISYDSNESGRSEVYVLPVSGMGGKWQISTDGGSNTRWRRDGKQLYYISPDFKLMAVDVSAHGNEFTAGVPRALFPLNIKHANGTQYDVSPDGKRFLINTPNDRAEAAPLTLVQNWTAALKK
jgi:eukaryotic-like serine/threonine-protein kinase